MNSDDDISWAVKLGMSEKQAVYLNGLVNATYKDPAMRWVKKRQIVDANNLEKKRKSMKEIGRVDRCQTNESTSGTSTSE